MLANIYILFYTFQNVIALKQGILLCIAEETKAQRLSSLYGPASSNVKMGACPLWLPVYSCFLFCCIKVMVEKGGKEELFQTSKVFRLSNDN